VLREKEEKELKVDGTGVVSAGELKVVPGHLLEYPPGVASGKAATRLPGLRDRQHANGLVSALLPLLSNQASSSVQLNLICSSQLKP